MKSLHNSPVGDLTRGGQITIHFLRMIGQVLQKFGLAAVTLYSVSTFGLWYSQTTDYERYLGLRYLASVTGVWLGNGDTLVPIETVDRHPITLTVRQIAESQKVKTNFGYLARLWLGCMVDAAFVAGFVLLSLFIWMFRFGRAQRRDTHLRGGQLVEGAELAKLVRRAGLAGDLQFGGIPLVKGAETGHIALTGSTGTGKTTAIYEFLKQIRKRGDRVVCYSPSGDFLSWFYRDGTDRVLNPFDARAPSWDLWGECDQPYHYAMIAGALIPVPTTEEKIWAEAAQSLVAVLLRELHRGGNPTIEELIRIVTMLPMESIYEFIKGTEVAANLDPKNDRMGASIRSTATIALRSMTYLPRGREPFTFKQWVEGEDDGSWLFLTARADQINAARPVLSTWLEVFVSRMLSLPESRTRRIWLIVDELPSLNRLPSLALFVEQARKFGGCGLLGFQQFSQLQKVYGKEDASTLVGMCNTWICFRQNDPETAKFVAQKFGQVEIEESHQGLSYGANDMRDGVSISAQRRDRDVIMPAEIMGLPNLAGFIKMVGDLPGGTFQLTRRTIKQVAQPYVAAARVAVTDAVAEPASPGAMEAGLSSPEGVTATGEDGGGDLFDATVPTSDLPTAPAPSPGPAGLAADDGVFGGWKV